MIMDSESNLLTAKEPPREIIVDDKVKLVLKHWHAGAGASCREIEDFPEPDDDIYDAILNDRYFRDDNLRQTICIKKLLKDFILIVEEYEDLNIEYYYKLSSASS